MAVIRNTSARRFEIEGQPSAFLQYATGPGRIRLIHTEVPAALRERGFASELAKGALDYARDHRLRVEVSCPFVRSYLERHPEYQPLVDHHHTPEEERRIREAALDETLEATFPASDPLSTDPNPDDEQAVRRR
jgi:predicted GNAT family acetyltransferase